MMEQRHLFQTMSDWMLVVHLEIGMWHRLVIIFRIARCRAGVGGNGGRVNRRVLMVWLEAAVQVRVRMRVGPDLVLSMLQLLGMLQLTTLSS